MKEIENKSLFDFSKTIASSLFEKLKYPFEAIAELKRFIFEISASLSEEEFDCPSEGIYIHKTAVVSPTAHLASPTIIFGGAEIRHSAFLRGGVIVGKGGVVGNSSEVKNSILFDESKAPHFNYVGDSILGYNSHLGAGAITSNVKSDKGLIVIHFEKKSIPTEMKKFGAAVGDFAEIGCGSVLCPGSVVGKNSTVYPLVLHRGVLRENMIKKSSEENAVAKFFLK